MIITVNRGALKLFLDLWKKEMFANYDKAERISGLKHAIDNIPLPLLREGAESGPEMVSFGGTPNPVNPKEILWQILKEPIIQ